MMYSHHKPPPRIPLASFGFQKPLADSGGNPRRVALRRSAFWRKNEFYFVAVSPEQNPNFFPTKSRCGMNRSATASLHSATPKKNVPCFSDMVVVKFFLKKERTFFFGVMPSRSQAGGGTMRTKFWQNYFLGRKGFAKTSAHLFLNSDVANGKGGVWGGIFHLLRFFLLAKFGRA